MRVAITFSPAKLPKGITEVFLRRVVHDSSLQAFPKLFRGATRGVKLEVVFVSDQAIAKLNQEYRGKSKPTDVLSFGNFSSQAEIQKAKEKTLDLGTLILSLPFIRRAAREDGVSWEREFTFVFSHGVLHLLGFDHEERMFEIQDTVTDTFFPLQSVKNKHS